MKASLAVVACALAIASFAGACASLDGQRPGPGVLPETGYGGLGAAPEVPPHTKSAEPPASGYGGPGDPSQAAGFPRIDKVASFGKTNDGGLRRACRMYEASESSRADASAVGVLADSDSDGLLRDGGKQLSFD